MFPAARTDLGMFGKNHSAKRGLSALAGAGQGDRRKLPRHGSKFGGQISLNHFFILADHPAILRWQFELADLRKSQHQICVRLFLVIPPEKRRGGMRSAWSCIIATQSWCPLVAYRRNPHLQMKRRSDFGWPRYI